MSFTIRSKASAQSMVATLSKFQEGNRVASARMVVGMPGGAYIVIKWIKKPSTIFRVSTAGATSKATAIVIVSIAAVSAI